MPTELIPFENPTLKLADTEAGLTTGTAFECQLTTAELVATANMVQVEQTPCQAATQIPGPRVVGAPPDLLSGLDRRRGWPVGLRER